MHDSDHPRLGAVVIVAAEFESAGEVDSAMG